MVEPKPARFRTAETRITKQKQAPTSFLLIDSGSIDGFKDCWMPGKRHQLNIETLYKPCNHDHQSNYSAVGRGRPFFLIFP